MLKPGVLSRDSSAGTGKMHGRLLPRIVGGGVVQGPLGCVQRVLIMAHVSRSKLLEIGGV